MIPAIVMVFGMVAVVVAAVFLVQTLASNRAVTQDVKQLRKEHNAMREVIDELLIGHVNEARMKRVLARMFDDEQDKR